MDGIDRMENRLLTLQEWDRKNFSKAHSRATLRKWARDGRIQPPPMLVGREYQVRASARYIPPNSGRIQRLRQARSMQNADLHEALTHAATDLEILEILSDAKATCG